VETDKNVPEKETTTEELKTLEVETDSKEDDEEKWPAKLATVFISVVISVLLSTVVNSIIMPWIHPLQPSVSKKERVAIVDHPCSGDYSLLWHYTIRPYKEWRWDNSKVWAYLTFQVRELSGQDRVFDLSE